MRLRERVKDAAEFVRAKHDIPDTAVVLGSGFKAFGETISAACSYDVADIPHFPRPSVQGHGASLIYGRSSDRPVLALTGRVHMYEGYSAQETAFAIWMFADLGVKNVILTNAAGGLEASLQPGSIIAIEDHINFSGQNCLSGDGAQFGERFVDMNNAYDAAWRERVTRSNEIGTGTYVSVLGPSFETAAETAMFARCGATMAGMSTVQECIAARQMGLNVLGLSFITNLAGGLSKQIDHTDVLAIGRAASDKLSKILETAIQTAPD